MRWITWPRHTTRTFWALIVIPRSRSMSIESRYCSRMSRASTAPVSSRIRSERVDLPWSTWATIARLRMRERSVMGAGTILPDAGGALVPCGPVHQALEGLAGGEPTHVGLDAAGEHLV